MNNLIKIAISFAFACQASAQSMTKEMPSKAEIANSKGFQNDLGKSFRPQKLDFKSLDGAGNKDQQVLKTKSLNSKNLDNQLSAGGHDGNGGDSDAQVAKAFITQTFTKLRAAYGETITVNDTKVSLDSIYSIIGNTRVLAVKGPLLKDGKPVEALNYPSKNLIEIDKEKFKKTHTRRLMIHEVLGLVKLEDSSYALSRELEKEYDLLFSSGIGGFPLDTVFQQAHQAWAQSRFSDISEAVDFINSKQFSCSWVGWMSPLLGHADPNQWLTRQDVVPAVQVRQSPLGQIVSIGMNTNFDGGSPGPAVLKNGKVETVIRFYDGSVSKAIAGKSGERLFIKLRDFRSEYSTDFENINVCQ